MSGLLIDRLAEGLIKAAAGNSHTSAAAAAILWTDKDRQWECVLRQLRQAIPQLLILGDYDVDQRAGPAIWLKCAIAGTLPEVKISRVPVVYLPGISRAELRAIETCPRDLQPLAELQYRGVFWSQANAKDWTVSAFLASKNGGLGLNVAQDKATQEALAQALQAGVLLHCKVEDLRNHVINAEWLLSLLAPNPTRDLLQWMNDPDVIRNKWGDVLWDVFVKRCKSDFGFDPLADGVLVAAELLAKGEGKWAAVAELYRDSYTSVPHVFDWLAKLPPPQIDLFPDHAKLSGYPQVNEQGESALRYALSACAAMDVAKARASVLVAEREHGVRRGWLWMRMGRAPLAMALEYLAEVAERSASLPIGQTPAELAENYLQSGWLVDQAALQALGSVQSKADLESVGGVLRVMYSPWLEESARRLQELTRMAGGLPTMQAEALPPGTCTVFVDGLRYDIAVRLQKKLSALGSSQLSARWTSLPSVTASGKAWCSPVAAQISGTANDLEFEPRVSADGKQLSGHNFRKLLSAQGVQPLDKHETGDPHGLAWTEAGDLDHYGHEHGLRLARDIDTQLSQVLERVGELVEAGWKRIRIVTDHGWLLLPGGLPKSELAKHQTETRWGRCAVLKDNASGTSLMFGWDWCKAVQVAYAPGISSFIAGADYAHGGISLQECLVPVLQVDCTGAVGGNATVKIHSVSWKGLRCSVVVESVTVGLKVDIRTKAALASSSLAASVKALEDGKASLAVADDDYLGATAILVVLGENGGVLQKQATTIGEQ